MMDIDESLIDLYQKVKILKDTYPYQWVRLKVYGTNLERALLDFFEEYEKSMLRAHTYNIEGGKSAGK